MGGLFWFVDPWGRDIGDSLVMCKGGELMHR